MRVRLLGPVEIWAGGRQLAFDRRRERLLLALLLLEPSRFVSISRLIDLFWPAALPPQPRRTLQVYASRLRAALITAEETEVQILGEGEGYRIIMPDGSTDLEDFNRLVHAARTTTSLPERSELLRAGLRLWRGAPLEDVASDEIRQRLCGGLLEARQAALDLRIDTDLQLGRHEQVLSELSELSEASRTNEKLAAARMLALYRCGRRSDSLDVYATTVTALADELGLDPSSQLRDLHVAILRSDPRLDWNGGQVAAHSIPPEHEHPRELPADLTVLVGRDDLLRLAADRLVAPRPPADSARVICIHGGSGMGKSAVATRLGHRVSDSYPDGQLFVRLMDVDGRVIDLRSVFGRLLRSLGMPPDRIPDTAEEMSALFRSRTAGRAVLIVLDDAISPAQVRPLLPASSRCAVIVTSRRPLIGLEDAEHVEVTPLSDGVSRDLLTGLAGPFPRTAVADAALDKIVRHCGGSPLALRIVGSRLALEADADLGAVAAVLHDRARRLDWLVAGDLAVRRSIDRTWLSADNDARTLLGRLALLGVDEFPVWVAAPLLRTTEAAGRRVLGALGQLGLVERRHSPAGTWYGIHGLVLSYALEKLSASGGDGGSGPDSGAEAAAASAVRRFLEATLALVVIADENVEHGIALGYEPTVDLPPCELREARREAAAGADWFDRQIPLVQAATGLAIRRGHPVLAAALVLRSNGYLAVRDDRERWVAMIEAARDAVRGAGLVELEARLEQALFGALTQREGTVDELAECSDRALAAARRSGSAALEIGALKQAGLVATLQCDFERARLIYRTATELIDRHPDLEPARVAPLEGSALVLIRTGFFDEAVPVLRLVCDMTPGSTRVRAIRLLDLAEALTETDRISDAEQATAEARMILQRIGDELGLGYVDVLEARIAVRRGDEQGAGRCLAGAERVFTGRFGGIGWAMHRVAQAELLQRSRGPAGAHAVLVMGLHEASERAAPLAAQICRLAIRRLCPKEALAE